MNLPVLYSFRRCPYAMRARLVLKYAGITVETREVDLSNPPAALLSISSDATVPVLQLPDNTVIEESWDIALWATRQNDPDLWMGENEQHLLESEMLIETNDYSFKQDLDHYKYSDRYPEHSMEYYRHLGEEFLQELEERLNSNRYLLSDSVSIADIGIFPFIRQFAMVDKSWFDQSAYVKLQQWLNEFIGAEGSQDQLFLSIMDKHKLWEPGDPTVLL